MCRCGWATCFAYHHFVLLSVSWRSSSCRVKGRAPRLLLLDSPAPFAADLHLRVLELQDQIVELQAALADKEDKLASRAQELLGLSASLLEKEHLLQQVGVVDANVSAVTSASKTVMQEELAELVAFSCKVLCLFILALLSLTPSWVDCCRS